MSAIDDGGPAFPKQDGMYSTGGMSLRDWFAGMALQGLNAHPEIGNRVNDDRIAEMAWSLSDAMLSARKGKEEA